MRPDGLTELPSGSAFLAICWRHPDLLGVADGFLLEALQGRGLIPGLEALLALLDPDVVAVDADLARRAVAFYQRFGKGLGHAAQLNVGDCFAAALAQREQLPLAYAGEECAAAGV